MKNDGNETSVLDILFRYLRYWKWFLVSVVAVLILVMTYVRYTVPIYSVRSTVLFKHEMDGRSAWAGNLSNLGLSGMGGVSSLTNETFVMRSVSLVRSVVDKLNLHTMYIVEGRFKSVDMYTDSPFIITMNDSGLDTLRHNIQFTAKLNEDMSISVLGTIGDKEYDARLTQLPGVLNTPHGFISFALREGAEPYYKPLKININPSRRTVARYRGGLEIERVDKLSSIIILSLNTPHAQKGIDFLDALIDVYNYKSIEDKNEEARNTRDFISSRLEIIDRELSSAEGVVEQYKLEHGMTDLDVDLMRNMQNSSRYEQLLVQAETQLSIVSSLNEYVKDPANDGTPVPTNIGIKDVTLAATSNEYNKLLAERKRLSKSIAENNPAMVKMNQQIQSLRNSINASIASVMEGLSIERRNIANQVRIYSGKIGNVPKQERQFSEIAREQEIKARLYTLLLQKREENSLALAATTNNAIKVDSASVAGMVHPKKKILLLAGLLIGLLLPVVVIYLLDLIQYKIRTRDDVDRLTQLPILGEIPTHKDIEEMGNIAVSENATTELDEAFRMIRINLTLSLAPDDQVVVFTSTIPGEGKTFVAINTALSLALLGKKVLLMGMDLRLPSLHTYINIPNDTGLSTYLSGYQEDIEKVINTTTYSKYLWVMPAGPIPPNPAELLSRHTLDGAIKKLRDMFDYIIVDSAPVASVSDTLVINRFVDANVYLCRANYSSKMNLKFANGLMTQGKLKNMLLVINDVKHPQHGYGYGYGKDNG